MNKKILLVSNDLILIREIETIIRFVEYEPTTISGTRELLQVDTAADYLFVLLQLTSGSDLQEAIEILRQRNDKVAIYALQPTGEESMVPLPGLDGFISHPVKYRNLLRTIRDAEAASTKNNRQQAHARNLIGVSPALREIKALASQVAKTDATVLILGESGTGKEVVARTIHQQSWRSDRAFVAVNCGAIPADLLESELFGHEKGAFTGAISSRRGRFELAEGGTLFLDEIGDMPMQMQVKLLRVLQDGIFERVGGSKSLRNTARIIAATHQNLEEKVENGSFRLDLYYRLNVFPIEIPPLRERSEDIPHLIREFTTRMASEKQLSVQLTLSAVEAISRHPLPGNVRELENLVERMAILHPDASVSVNDLPARYQFGTDPRSVQAAGESTPDAPDALPDGEFSPDPRHALQNQQSSSAPDDGVNLKQHLVSIERKLVLDALDQTNWVVTKAAKLLGLQRTTLTEKMRKLGISKSA